jgi:hypothetical protein
MEYIQKNCIQEKFILTIPLIINKLINLSEKDKRPSIYKSHITDNLGAFLCPCDHIIDNIYLGSCLAAGDYDLLNKLNVAYICNISDTIPNFFENRNIQYFNIKKKDNGLEDLTKKELDNSYNFILNSQKKNKKVLVHCFVGRSRSASILIYYLMHKYELTVKESIIYLKNKRKWVNPSIKFINNIIDIIENMNRITLSP